jgi:hypothetical protein
MSGFDTYTQLRQAEDVQDVIYDISPVDNPVASMSRTMRATAKIHQWTEDSIAAAAANRVIEGAAAGSDTSTAVTEKLNYCQIMAKVAEVTGTLEAVDKYGRDSEMAYQLEKRYKELANDEELAIVGAPGGTRQAGTAGAAGTARQMKSLHSQLDASVIKDAAAVTTVVNLEKMLLDAHQATWAAGGNPTYLVTDGTRARHISAMAYSAGRTRQFGNVTSIVNVIDLYVSNYGQLDVVLDRNIDDCYLLLDFNYLATPVLRPTQDWDLAKAGDSDKRQILRESTYAVLNSKAHAMIDNIATTLT